MVWYVFLREWLAARNDRKQGSCKSGAINQRPQTAPPAGPGRLVAVAVPFLNGLESLIAKFTGVDSGSNVAHWSSPGSLAN
jgi:hypothetical protein